MTGPLVDVKAAPPVAWARGALYMVVAAVGFAIMNACAKEASRRVPFIEVAFARSIVGAVAIVLWARARRTRLRIQNRRVMLLRVTSGTAAMSLTFYALSVAPLGETSALLNLTPLFVAAIGFIWLRERIAPLVGACLAAGMVGAGLVFRPHVGAPLGLGGAAAVGAALTSALAMTSLRRLGSTESSESVVAAFLVTGTVVTGLFSVPAFVVPQAFDLLLLLVSGLTATVAQVAMTRAYAEDLAARVGGMNYLNIVVSLVLGSVVFGERPDLLALVGIVAILGAGGGLVFSAYRERERLPAT